MKTSTSYLKLLVICFLGCLLGGNAHAQEGPFVDYGDSTSQTLVGKAQSSMGGGQAAQAVLYADRCIELYGQQALDQQKVLAEEPKEKDAVFKNWALNDVGYCYLIKGQALEKLGKRDEAIAVYKFLAQKLAYSKVWDPQGWFWPPAVVAQERVKTLEFSTL